MRHISTFERSLWVTVAFAALVLVSKLFAQVDDSNSYITKAEFDAFLREYRSRSNDSAIPVMSPQDATVKGLAWKKGLFTITPYGYINVSASYESEKSVAGDYIVYANSPDLDGKPAFFIDPRSTRIGVSVDAPGFKTWEGSKSKAVVEVDFQGSYSIRNRGSLMLRKAFVEVGNDMAKFLVGQDWEILSPLYPQTLNYTAGAGTGNIGYRRAQLRYDRKFFVTQHTNWLLQTAMVDNVLRDGFNAGNAVTPNVSDWPIIEGRLAYTFLKGYKDCQPVTLGVSAHVGEQRFDFNNRSDIRKLQTWSFNIDMDIPITKKLRLQAELFMGDNLGSFEGGIIQGVDLNRRDTIRSQGGWIDLEYRWTDKLRTNICYMIDDPYDEDVVSGNATNNTARNYCQCIFGNVLYNWTPALMTGFEVSFWKTHWQKYDGTNVVPMRAGEPVRFEFVTRFTF